MVNDVINPNNLLKVCVIASDMSKCLAINTWRDEDQELENLLKDLESDRVERKVSISDPK